MKVNYITLCAMLSLPFNISSQQVVRFIEFSNPIQIINPAKFDSINVKNENYDDFSNIDLFSSSIRNYSNKIESDTSGYFKILNNSEFQTINWGRFYLRSDRFTTLKLKIYSNEKFQLFLSDKKIGEKKTVQDSLINAESIDVNLDMEPGQKEFNIKLLSKGNQDSSNLKIEIINENQSAHISLSETGCHPLTIEDLMTGERVYSSSISPNGNYLVIKSALIAKDGKRSEYKRLYSLKTNSFISDLSDKENLMWMPESEKLSYTRIGFNGKNLISLDPDKGTEFIIAENIPSGEFKWTPNEKNLIFDISESPEETNKEVYSLYSPDDRIPGWKNRNSVYIYSLENGQLKRMIFGNKNYYVYDISPDSKKAIIEESFDKPNKYPFNFSSFYQIDLESFSVDSLWQETAYIKDVKYSPNGKQLIITASGDAFNGIGLNINNGQISNLFDNQAFICDVDGKNIQPISKNFNPSIENAIWNRYDNIIYFKCTDKDYESIYSFLPKTGTFKKIDSKHDVVTNFSFASKASKMAVTGVTVSSPEFVSVANLKNGKVDVVYEAQKNKSENYELGEVRSWDYISENGTTIEGRYYLPSNFDESKKYPMIVYYYGGTSPTSRNFFHPYSMHLYAAQGYIVYVLQPSGTTGFGQEFAARHVNAWGKLTADDIINGTKRFCEEHHYVDESKIGCMGASYGGFMTMYLQTRSDIFAAAVSHAGISSLSSYWGEGYWGYTYSAIASAYSYPWNNKELYVDQSPLYHADKINTPMLLLHGKADTNVPVGESIQMYNALKILGKDVEFIQVEGENHGIAQFDKRIAWKKSIMAFFAKHLKDQPEWWNKMYPNKPY